MSLAGGRLRTCSPATQLGASPFNIAKLPDLLRKT
jgi:hypothetical protein